MTLQPFHLAIPVSCIVQARAFYGGVLKLAEGRSSQKWQDYSLFGHQLVCHEATKDYKGLDYYNPVDKDDVPVPHFGVALTIPEFEKFAEHLKKEKVEFIIPPHKRFEGAPGEQWTMFFKDPFNNNLEFKAMTNPENLFAKYHVEQE